MHSSSEINQQKKSKSKQKILINHFKSMNTFVQFISDFSAHIS